jgi:hypothetical protein
MPEVPASEIVVLDALDEVLQSYINKSSPIKAALDGRISITNETTPTNGPGSGNGNGSGSSAVVASRAASVLLCTAITGLIATLLL